MPIQNRRAFGGSASTDESGSGTLKQVPDVEIFADSEGTIRTATVRLIFLWNIDIGGFVSSVVAVSAGTIGDLDGEGNVYSALVTLPANAHGTLNVTLSANSVESADGVYGPSRDSVFSFNYDTRAVSVSRPTGAVERGGTYAALGYRFEGCLEIKGVVFGGENYIYAVFQRANYTSYVEASPPVVVNLDYDAQGVNTTRQAEAILYKIRLSTGTWTALRTYDTVATAARSLIEVNGTVYWFEGSHYAYYNAGILYNIENPEGEFYVSLGELTRKATASSAGEWSVSGDRMTIVVDKDSENYAQIKSAFNKQGSYLTDGRFVILKSNIAHQVIGSRATFAFDYDLADGTLPAVDEKTDFDINIASYKEVYSNYRLRRLWGDVKFRDKNWKAQVGHLYSIHASVDTPVDLGVWISAPIESDPYRDSERPHWEDYDVNRDPDKFYAVHGGMASPLIWDGERLSFVAGYGRLDQLTENAGEAARTENWQWLQYSEELNPRVLTLETNGRTSWDVIKDTALLTDSYIAIEGDAFKEKPRLSARGTLEGGLSATHTGELVLENVTRDTLPSSGLLRAQTELLRYSQLTNGNPDTLTRGVDGTTAASHAADTPVYWVDHIIEYDRSAVDPMDRIVVNNDTTNIFNFIRVRFGDDTWAASDADSISKYGLLALPTIDIGLDATQKQVAKFFAERYLSQLKRPRQVVTLTLKLSLYLEMMDVLLVREGDRTHLDTLVQVIDIDDLLFKNVSVVRCVLL